MSETSNISKQILKTNTELPTFHFVMLKILPTAVPHLAQTLPSGGMNWEIGIDIYTLICIKWITNKNLLYKKIN